MYQNNSNQLSNGLEKVLDKNKSDMRKQANLILTNIEVQAQKAINDVHYHIAQFVKN